MPFDNTGNFTLTYDFTDDRDAGIKVRADRMDAQFTDIATALNEVFFRNGMINMTGALRLGNNAITQMASGTVSNPSLSFSVSPSTGIYAPVAGVVGISASGVKVAEARANAFEFAQEAIFSGGASFPEGLNADTIAYAPHGNLALLSDALPTGLSVSYGVVNDFDSGGVSCHVITSKYDKTRGIQFLFPSINDTVYVRAGTSISGFGPYKRLVTADEFGPGNGMDADKLDGLDSTDFIRRTVDQVITGGMSFNHTVALNGASTTRGFEVGFRPIPTSGKVSGAINDREERGKCIALTSEITLVPNVFQAGDTLHVYNDTAFLRTIIAGTGMTVRLAGTALTGSRDLATRAFCQIWFKSTSECVISGNGIS